MVSPVAFALGTADLLNDAAAKALLEKKCIRTEACGVLPARFDAAVGYLNQPDLVQRIQGEYRQSVSKDGTIDFPIVGTGNGTYYYVNEKNQRTDLFELCRRQTSDSTFDLVYHATGKRFFGKYEVLIHIRAIDAGPAGTVYTASVHAYPHNGPVRFFARRFGTVERYFQRKTRLIARVSTRICAGMDGTPSLTCQPLGQFTDGVPCHPIDWPTEPTLQPPTPNRIGAGSAHM
ncbi:MAG: hypothetical protein ABFR33_02750 [Verrucomicrobiota bacterium]